MRRIVTFILMLVEIVAMADTPKYLLLHHAGGKVESYSISNIRKITFGKQTANNLEVYQKTKTTVDNYPYSTFEKGTFEVDPSGVEGVLTDNNDDLSVVYNSGSQEIMVSSSQEITAIVVCNLNGMVVEMLTPMTTEATVSLADYASGMYVVKAVTATATQIQKIVKH
ncbi:MAG: T9SS type A sorting domain-containing protein [Muribaculaceae bacterium]|nr:T9SS type A sorting domain-containing protein [Muribaculaceae bacterium]